MTAQTVSSAVATRSEGPIAVMFSRKRHFAAVLPASVDAEAFLGTAAGALYASADPDPHKLTLMQAATSDPDSLITAMMRCAALGHLPGTDEFYLTPRKVKGRPTVLGIEGYRGIVERMYRSGAVQTVIVREVCAKDKFKFIEGEMDRPQHATGGGDVHNSNSTGADFFGADGSRDRGPMVGVYAYAILTTGAVSRVVLLNRDDVLAARDAGGYRPDDPFTPWNRFDAGKDHPELQGRSMWWKTAARRLEPWVPTSAEYRREMLRASASAAAIAGTVDPRDGSAPVPVTASQAARLAVDGIETDVHDAEIVEEQSPAGTASNDLAKHEDRSRLPGTKAATDKLNGLMHSLPLGPPAEQEENENLILQWLGGPAWDGTRGQLQMVTGQIESFIEAAKGDLDAAASAIWQRYREQHPEASDD